jgi:hypothetical protein
MPIDMTLWSLVQENKAAVIRELLRQFDPSHDSDDPIPWRVSGATRGLKIGSHAVA